VVEWILGEDACRSEIRTNAGTAISRLSWSLAIEVGCQARRVVAKSINRVVPVKAALLAARSDNELLQRHFNNTVSVSAGAAAVNAAGAGSAGS
jgi:hypothetical protein